MLGSESRALGCYLFLIHQSRQLLCQLDLLSTYYESDIILNFGVDYIQVVPSPVLLDLEEKGIKQMTTHKYDASNVR